MGIRSLIAALGVGVCLWIYLALTTPEPVSTQAFLPVQIGAGDADIGNVDLEFAGVAAAVNTGASGTTTQRVVNANASMFRSLDLDETEEEIKGTAGELCGVWLTNTATTTRWVKFYNATAATVVVGSTTPSLTFGIPGNSTDDVGGAIGVGTGCIAFSTAITVAATTGVGDPDTGPPGVNDVVINVFYR